MLHRGKDVTCQAIYYVRCEWTGLIEMRGGFQASPERVAPQGSFKVPDARSGQEAGDSVSVRLDGLGDVGHAGLPQEGDGRVPQPGRDVRGRPGFDPAGVLPRVTSRT